MASPVDEDREAQRQKRTVLLMIGGALSLLLPLLAAVYIRMTDVQAPTSSGGSAFAHRASAQEAPRIAPAITPAPSTAGGGALAQVPVAPPRESSPAPIQADAPSAPQGGSLGFIRGGDDYYKDKDKQAAAGPQVQQPQTQQAQAAPPPPPQVAAAEPAAKRGKPAPKPFSMPKLQPTKGFSSFRGGGGGMGSQQGGGAMEAGAQGGADPAAAMQAMQGMQGMPGGGAGAQRPMAQMNGKTSGFGQGHGPNGVPADALKDQGMPDMGAMMKNIPGGGAGGLPDVSSMLQNMPGQEKK